MADDDDDGSFGEGLQVELFHAETDREPGDTNWQGYGFDVHPQVFFISAFVVLAFIALSLIFQDGAADLYSDIRTGAGTNFSWLFIMAANLFIIFMVYLAISKYGKIRLGGVNADKEFSDISWVAMLFSAGMGIGLMFFGVGEPIWHLNNNVLGTGADPSAVGGEAAMAITLFHWGFHPWAIYALVGLSLAFFSFNRGLPLTFRSIFWPVLGERIYGWPGHIIDILTVFATLFGLTTSLGLGALQINAGLNFLGENSGTFPAIETSTTVQVLIIAVVTGVAVMSVAAGLDGGVKRLSNLNLGLMFALLASVFVLGPTLFMFNLLPQGIGAYLGNFFELSFFAGALGSGAAGGYPYDGFLNAWTIFYWAWWIAWSPFVGMFIARISKGRTVREFVAGVLVLPVIFSFVWFAALGGTALNMELNSSPGAIYDPMLEGGTEVGMFAMFQELPGTLILSAAAILLTSTFFITSSDSGSLVIDHLTSGGKHDAPVTMRIFWAVSEGVVAATLLIAGGEAGLEALQAAAISTGLPFAVILIFMMYAIYKGLQTEYQVLESREFQERVSEMAEEGEVVVDSEGGEIITDISGSEEEPGD